MSKKNKNKYKHNGVSHVNRVPEYVKLALPEEIFHKINALTQEAKGEISTFGRTIIKEKDFTYRGKVILVEELGVFRQECEGAHTSLKSADLAQMYVGVARAGGQPEQWNFWHHSHVRMDVGFSHEDETTMKNLTIAKNGQEGSTLVALCTNKFGDFNISVYKNGICVSENLQLMIVPNLSTPILENAREAIKNLVTYVRDTKHMFTDDNKFGSRVIPYAIDERFGNDFESDLTEGDLLIGFPNDGYLPVTSKVLQEATKSMSKNKRRKLARLNKKQHTFQREPGWGVRPS